MSVNRYYPWLDINKNMLSDCPIIVEANIYIKNMNLYGQKHLKAVKNTVRRKSFHFENPVYLW